MANRYTSISVSPSKGGALMSRVSASQAGIANYLIKRDWRRDSDYEMRREGYDYFGDFDGLDIGTQPFPAGISVNDPITLIHLARSRIGKTQVIVGTQTSLFVFVALEFEYVLDPTSSLNPYVDPIDVQGGTEPFFAFLEWGQIGSGFSATGRRWEATNINGYTIFNNGVDLPVYWRIGDSAVSPMTELRDLGVAHVGTIAAFSNILMLGDIREIPAADHVAWMNGSTPYGMYPDGESTDRYQYRLLWSAINEPTEVGVVVEGTSTTASATLTMDYPSESFIAGDKVVVIGAGVAGGNLYTTVSSVSGTSLVLDDVTPTATTSALVQRQSAIGSISGYDDLADDASGILKMAELMGQLVIYKDTSSFLAKYTGIVSAPFQFTRMPTSPGRTLYYKNSLTVVDGKYHIYAGRNAFYRFDLQTRQPREIPLLDACSDVFFDDPNVNISNTNSIFSSLNPSTKEIWFTFPSSTADKSLCLDIRYSTASTTSIDITAAAAVKRPTLNIVPVETEDWFVMGTANGTVLIYGNVDQPLVQWSDKSEIFYRRSSKSDLISTEDYTSTLSAGLSDFRDQFNEKDLRSYLPNLSSQQDGLTDLGLSVRIYSSQSQTGTETLVVDHLIDEPNEHLVSLFARAHNFRDEILIAGKDNPVKLASRTYEVSKVGSRSGIRRDD